MEELRTITEEAHKFGKHAVAHCASSQGMVNALEAGIDTIFHAIFNEPDGTSRFRPEIAERMARQGVFVNPTLHGERTLMRLLEDKMEREGLTEGEQATLDKMRREDETRLDHVARMRDAGVRMVCGSDSAWDNYQMGGFQHEVALHVEAGMSPMEAIVSATSDSARSCWMDHEVGTLEPGKRGDILVVEGDPSRGRQRPVERGRRVPQRPAGGPRKLRLGAVNPRPGGSPEEIAPKTLGQVGRRPRLLRQLGLVDICLLLAFGLPPHPTVISPLPPTPRLRPRAPRPDGETVPTPRLLCVKRKAPSGCPGAFSLLIPGPFIVRWERR